MRPFDYIQTHDAAEATRAGAATGQGEVDARTQYLAGGTTLLDLMKLDVLRPSTVVDISSLKSHYGKIESDAAGLRLGAMVSMAAAAADPTVAREYPAVAQSLLLAASAQLRNMATLSGNVLQRTRCAYYRDPSWSSCNKRIPGSGCAALHGSNRNHAILGVDESCIAQYPGDFAIALTAMEARVHVRGAGGERDIGIEDLHQTPAKAPHKENTLKPGDIITGFQIPAAPWTRRSLYLKIRDRESYEFAIASVAVALDISGGVVRQARVALGGMAYKPWRAHEAEAHLAGKVLNETTAMEAAKAALAGAVTHGENDYKPELARRAVTRALLQAAAMEV